MCNKKVESVVDFRPTKPFLAYGYITLYPRGRLDDFLGEFDTKEEAKKAILNSNSTEYGYIIDCSSMLDKCEEDK